MNNQTITAEEFVVKYGAERVARILPLLEEHGYVTVTEAGMLLLAEAKRLSSLPFGGQLDPADRPAANRLREWRKNKAREENVSAYIILPNKKLFALAVAHPSTAAELAVLGVSRRVVDAYADEILAACRRDSPVNDGCRDDTINDGRHDVPSLDGNSDGPTPDDHRDDSALAGHSDVLQSLHAVA